jgi:hypothetical protein
VDADVIFTNQAWLLEGVEQLQKHNIIQPFEYCAHLEKDELKPSFDMDLFTSDKTPNIFNSKVWRSFCANYADSLLWQDSVYDTHGHVGFAWGAKRGIGCDWIVRSGTNWWGGSYWERVTFAMSINTHQEQNKYCEPRSLK